ncbi:MAG: ammonium transporter [Nitrososphaerota archaeon]|nr:ammonium transporter [Nitrososphaerota archaeon]MDG7049190.1 ammonium transporter [Nitrososphaerota archaeon]MDG7051203.1 ammonium transporter [Nitrososphaerota archaeon]
MWVLLSAILVFMMTASVGLLEVGELGEDISQSLLKGILITGIGVAVMAFIGFNTAFAPTIDGIIGNPFYTGLFLGGFSTHVTGIISGVWWSMTSTYTGTGLTTGTYFLFEAAFAAVTFALVAVIALKKLKIEALVAFAIVYFIFIWNLPAAWIWNPTGWMYLMGVRDFAGGLVVHAAAGATGFALVLKIWQEERKKGLERSPQSTIRINPGMLTISILLLWVGWFGFNPGSELALTNETTVVVLTTFIAAAMALASTMFFQYLFKRSNPGLLYAVNGILMGLIIITPLAGYVSPASAAILGVLGGPLFLAGERFFGRFKWFSDPIGLFPGHMLGGIFGITMIAFFTQNAFAAASGAANLPNGLLFGGGFAALGQLGLEVFGVAVVMSVVFVLSYATISLIGIATHGITTDYKKEGIIS